MSKGTQSTLNSHYRTQTDTNTLYTDTTHTHTPHTHTPYTHTTHTHLDIDLHTDTFQYSYINLYMDTVYTEIHMSTHRHRPAHRCMH